ncbi:hypothetical protein AURDEDRAFT_180700 [Auricularia subglabra TFB-10046 SS5]|nr:hypothetical protein AURDEDRAFT_180700 [Auricularia subglabra TFB-10046 SS5]
MSASGRRTQPTDRVSTLKAPSSPIFSTDRERELFHRASHSTMSSSDTSPAQGDPFPLPLSRPPSPQQPAPAIFGLPLKYVSLVTLAVQNALLTIIMHYSRVSTPPEKAYSAAVAVLLNELLKGSISFAIALTRIDGSKLTEYRPVGLYTGSPSFFHTLKLWPSRFRKLSKEIFSADCWKLSIPAILYVVQNNLQYVAASNLDIATFQVTYQMKILTTAAFSVLLLRKKLSSTKWFALLALALGVGIVQIQAGANKTPHAGSASAASGHEMHPTTGFLAVSAACFTSGLAGVYFEMVLKGSQADLWVRNVQLSLFSLLPALLPVLFNQSASSSITTWWSDMFRNFGFWAWATVSIQVFGGLVTAVVIKYSDNILKGFATSLSIIISFLASVVLFNFRITPAFVIGASVVLGATWLYNQPAHKDGKDAAPVESGRAVFPGSPVDAETPIIAQFPPPGKKRASLTVNPRAVASMLGLTPADPTPPYYAMDSKGSAGYLPRASQESLANGAPVR